MAKIAYCFLPKRSATFLSCPNMASVLSGEPLTHVAIGAVGG